MTWYELLNLTDIPDYARYMIIGIMLAAFHDLLANLINDDTLQISQFVPPCGNFVSAAAAGTSPGGCITPCQHGNAETVRVLIEKGADVNAINDRGQSPIAGAVFKGYDEVVKVLVEEGRADVNAGQPSAVQAAHMFKRDECLRLFGVEGEEWSIGPQ